MVGTTSGRKVWKWSYQTSQRKSASSNDEGIIFNDGSNQTSNLIFVNGGYYDGSGTLIGVVPDPAGINEVSNTPSTSRGTYYNLAGQKVDKNYKGIVIVNGKKYLRK
jgi:alpha-amylase